MSEAGIIVTSPFEGRGHEAKTTKLRFLCKHTSLAVGNTMLNYSNRDEIKDCFTAVITTLDEGIRQQLALGEAVDVTLPHIC